ncbi:hypothetical protein LBMAG23_13280 [Bacteroidota bacterium]|nr:hypothetical protein LBMAG23_13280 [Bacteroidota bacterium]
MEVHHPHHPTHKKKWPEYIIEFVMLFTAVTLGFFVENYREHYVEKMREEQFILDIRKDIIFDSIQLSKLDHHQKKRRQFYDSLLVIYNKGNWKEEIPALQKYNSVLSGKITWEPRQETYKQLISTGSLRFFSDRKFVEELKEYEIQLNRLAFRRQRFLQHMYDFYEPINQKHFITLYDHPEDNYMVAIDFLNDKSTIENPFSSVKRLNHQESFDLIYYMSVVSTAILLEAYDNQSFVQPLLEQSRKILASTEPSNQ